MAIAIIPQNYNPETQSDEKGWLTMNEVDEMICKAFGVEPDPVDYYMGWFDRFIVFNWYNVKEQHPTAKNYFVFENTNEAVYQYFRERSVFQDNISEFCQFITEYIEPLIKVIYDNGYKICSWDRG